MADAGIATPKNGTMVRIPFVVVLAAGLTWGSWLTLQTVAAKAEAAECRMENEDLKGELRRAVDELARMNKRLDDLTALILVRRNDR